MTTSATRHDRGVDGSAFGLSPEQEMLRTVVHEFVERECPKPVARELEASEDFPVALARSIAKADCPARSDPSPRCGSCWTA